MEVKNMDDLRAAHPDIVAQIEAAAKAEARTEGVNSERARIQGIEAIEAAIGDKEMVKNAKYGENPLTAEQLALKAMQAQAAIGATVVNQLEADANNSGAADVTGAPAAVGVGEDEQAEQEAINFMASVRPMKKEV